MTITLQVLSIYELKHEKLKSISINIPVFEIANNQKPICSPDHFLWVSIKSPLKIVTIMNPPPIMSIHGMKFMLTRRSIMKIKQVSIFIFHCWEEEND